jgi:hypothetical protein
MFHTNDPTQPRGRVEFHIAKVTGGLLAFPISVVFGDVAVGRPALQIVEIWDAALEPRIVQQVESSIPERFTVQYQPVKGGEVRKDRGRLIGRIEVCLNTREPGFCDGAVLVHLDDSSRAPESIPVTGRVTSLIEARPGSITLPRASPGGLLFYGETSLEPCRYVELVSASQDLGVQIRASEDNPSCWIVRVDWPEPASRRGQFPSCRWVRAVHAIRGPADHGFACNKSRGRVLRRAGLSKSLGIPHDGETTFLSHPGSFVDRQRTCAHGP